MKNITNKILDTLVMTVLLFIILPISVIFLLCDDASQKVERLVAQYKENKKLKRERM